MTQGWQSFTTGEVLTSTAMNQIAASTVNVFASASARDAAIPGSDLAEGLICYLLDDNSIYTYSGSGWVINGTGTITGITTSNGLAGSGTSGSVALTLDTDAKGDLLVGTGADTSTKLTVGTNTHVLTADSSTASGLVWSAPTTGDITEVAAGTNIDVTSGTGPVPSVALAIDSAVSMGADGAGVDVTFHSSTAGDSMLWDASEEKLVITGTNGQNSLEVADGDVTITDSLTVSGGLIAPLQINAQTGTTYTFVLADAGKLVTSSNGSAQTITIPPNSSVAFPIGTQIMIQNIGTANATVAQGSGVTIQSKDSNKEIDGQFAGATCIKTATDTWSLIGALK